VHTQEWGAGDPVIALHPLALESTAFAGLGEDLAVHGLRTIAADLPGFGATPAPAEPLTPAVLARPVIELARELETPPLVLGMSMGGRVALEAALEAPEVFRGAVLVAPYLPWRRYRRFMRAARWLDPSWAERLPLERCWPVLERVAGFVDGMPKYEHDWLMRSAARFVYYGSCPATRHAFLSASRELALDPAHGPRGLWTRLAGLEVSSTFVWGGRDGLIPKSHATDVAAIRSDCDHVDVECAAHFVSGPHYRCMRRATTLAVLRTLEAASGDVTRGLFIQAPCVVEAPETDFERARGRPAQAAPATGGTP
jgi:pimeloyl-ACP methyl ester carboxylesterase